MTHTEDDLRAAAADIAFRRRALTVNGAIYARRHGPCLLPVLAGGGTIKARYIGQIAWLASERDWRSQDARCLAELADEIGRFGALRPDVAEACRWHADRLRELVRQHAVLAKLDAEHRPNPAWPAAGERPAAGARRRASAPAASRSLRA